MRHDIVVNGYSFGLRPVESSDATFIVNVRQNNERNRFLHTVSADVDKQKLWLKEYYSRESDYYFLIRDLYSNQPEGLIALYNIESDFSNGVWGRWVLKQDSLAAIESAWMIYQVAFDVLQLRKVRSQTVANNLPVVSFHNSCGISTIRTFKDFFNLSGMVYDCVEHETDRSEWPVLAARLEKLAARAHHRRQVLPMQFEKSESGKAITDVEVSRLESVAQSSLYTKGIMPSAIDYCYKIFSRHLTGQTILELGPAEGLMTRLLSDGSYRVTVVDASPTFCAMLREQLPTVRVVETLFEFFEPDQLYDNIILGHVLEHVEDPVDILRRVKSWLAPNGKVLAAVPNARSLHRQAAVTMGLLMKEEQLNDMDSHHGHRRVFNPESYRACFIESGLTVEIFGGYWLKPLSNSQIDEYWTPDMIRAFFHLGERYPDIAGEIYVIAGH